MAADGWAFCARCGFDMSTLEPLVKPPPSFPTAGDIVVNIDSSPGVPLAQTQAHARVLHTAAQFVPSQSHKQLAGPLDSALRSQQHIGASIAEASRQISISKLNGKAAAIKQQKVGLRVTPYDMYYTRDEAGIVKFTDKEERGKLFPAIYYFWIGMGSCP